MKHFPWRECGWAGLVLVVLAGLYVGAYYANVVRIYVETPYSVDGCLEYRATAWYRAGGDLAEVFFSPIHEIDRQLSDKWKYHYEYVNRVPPP